MAEIIERNIEKQILRDLSDIEAVFINGARQVGKSTFVQIFKKHFKNVFYFTFDDISTRAIENDSPGKTFQNITDGLIILDEVQLIPNSFLAIKAKIDNIRLNKQKVKFLLTGSADIMLLPKLSQALVGRMYIRTMYPFSAAEIMKSHETFINNMFGHKPKSSYNFSQMTAEKMISKATFPQLSLSIKDKTSWCQSYLSTIFERDLKNLSDIDKIESLPQLTNIFANHIGGLLNDTNLASSAKLSLTTIRRYRILLEGVFLISLMPPWLKNIGKRFTKSPKIYFNDTMLLCHILGLEPKSIEKYRPDLYGFILENFVASEIRKQLSLLGDGKLYYFRTQDQKEIDFIIEKRDGSLLAIEVKSSHTIYPTDFNQIRFLKKQLPKNFIRGIVLYQGDKILHIDDDMYAMPIKSLWEI